MVLVAGLGNPGERYAATPHNLGFLVVDVLAARHSIRMSRLECQAVIGQGTIGGNTVLLAKPQTFMNHSGIAVKPLVQKNEVDPKDLILVYDELALPWGSLRLRPNGSAAGHNGVQSVIDQIGTQEFPRVRLGAHPGYQLVQGSGADYLLSRFSRQQNETLEEFISLAADATESIIAEGVSLSMTRFNRRAPGTAEDA
jgi:PTH1 family peptidyl-tRNA hydrolase